MYVCTYVRIWRIFVVAVYHQHTAYTYVFVSVRTYVYAYMHIRTYIYVVLHTCMHTNSKRPWQTEHHQSLW